MANVISIYASQCWEAKYQFGGGVVYLKHFLMIITINIIC